MRGEWAVGRVRRVRLIHFITRCALLRTAAHCCALTRARRMGKVFKFLGLTCAAVTSDMTNAEYKV